MRALFGVALVAMMACNSSDPGEQCIPGSSVSCACPAGRSGAQVCNDEGTFDPCDCVDVDDAGATHDAHVAVDAATDASADAGGHADAGPRICATDSDCEESDPCRLGHCDSASRICVVTVLDGDGDGHGAAACGGDDCDDGDPDVYPGAPELCDGRRSDCAGTGPAEDADGDGHLATDATCTGGTLPSDDCDDSRSDVYPMAVERCDGRDNDCDGLTDEGEPSALCMIPGAVASCTGGHCVFEGCTSHYADCNGSRADGCEVDLWADDANCGGCGAPCGSGTSCCSGSCVDTTSDVDHCGSCSTRCSPYASDRCVDGACMCGAAGPCSAPFYCLGMRCDSV